MCPCLQPVLKLQSGHKSAVVKLMVCSLRPPAGGYAASEAVAVGHAAGSLTVYEPLASHRPGQSQPALYMCTYMRWGVHCLLFLLCRGVVVCPAGS